MLKHRLGDAHVRSLATAFALVASVLLPRAAKAENIVDDPFPRQQAAVAQALHDVFEAFEQGDVDRLEAFHLYGPKFSKFDDMPPSRRLDAAAARQKERAALSSLETFNAKVEDLKVDVLGAVAVATFILRYSFDTGEVSGSSSARSTMVFVDTGGRWRIVHEHFSRLEEPE